ncbi:hypothetical protein PROFUN_04736 [Planoprotostelium fungivorum]|uniref:Superkiller viralicidic activity 2-like 2 n=1 Tax=Planoprotostelium fungivorum TaxID=1890364 RepID=A0A2P6NFY3_9EUKA|nr:hypothetical protein PROFUN_04736 [Planoprotostelium fungivorum]
MDDLFSVFQDTSSKPKTKRKISEDENENGNGGALPAEYNDEMDIKLQRDVDREVARSKKAKTVETPDFEVRIAPKVSIRDTSGAQQVEILPSTVEEDAISCLHELCLPPLQEGQEYPPEFTKDPVFPANPARTYKFKLDPFQHKSVCCLEANHSVLVSAHTSAGKTVVAEYAIAMSLARKQRVIYTSPIKALSNQKYRELYEDFQDVGLMTGDTTINPNASCLVMTTEILRSMLYRGSEVMREVAWVIFDEIHYMRDKERGVVWEETIILLPPAVRFVFLSATIPNAKEFALWVAKIHKQPCHVVYTDVRPTPLQHYIFPAGGDGLHLVVDEKGVFRDENFRKALAALAQKEGTKPKKGGNNKSGTGNDVYKIVNLIMVKNYHPVIVFCFSKKECETLAMQMSRIDLSSDEEKQTIEKVFNNAIDILSEEDRTLPQIVHILPLLKRGVGIHHSGLLPILKEVIEILFQEGLIKALFATETFSMGLNMPAKTVVFTSVKKFDGTGHRWLTGGEYIQMSGRAGRRGLDDRGIVIMMVDAKMEPEVAKGMVKGQADALMSSFHIKYNMLLNLLRVEEINPEYMLRRSFHQFQVDRGIPVIKEKIKMLEAKRDDIEIKNENQISNYFELEKTLDQIQSDIRKIIVQPVHILPFLQPGRMIKIIGEGEVEWDWGVVVNFQKKGDKGKGNKNNLQADYVVDILLSCEPNLPTGDKPKPPTKGKGVYQIVPVMLSNVKNISSIRLYVPKDLTNPSHRESVGKSLQEVNKRFPDGIPHLDPIEDMKIDSPDFKQLVRKAETTEERLRLVTNNKTKDKKQLERYAQKVQIEGEIKVLRGQAKDADEVILKDNLRAMGRVLRRLEYSNQDDIIETKGRVACEINAADELVITELIFGGTFNDLTVEQTVALLSCFSFGEKSDDVSNTLKEELKGPFRVLQNVALRVSKVEADSKIAVEPEEYVKKFTCSMMNATYAWAKGAKFSEVCTMTEVFEGSIIRSMRRLEELLRQLAAASKSIGNTALEAKFSEGIVKIKRDIVFAASLYL